MTVFVHSIAIICFKLLFVDRLGPTATLMYALCLDFRTIDENTLHGMGRRIENASEGITLQVEKG